MVIYFKGDSDSLLAELERVKPRYIIIGGYHEEIEPTGRALELWSAPDSVAPVVYDQGLWLTRRYKKKMQKFKERLKHHPYGDAVLEWLENDDKGTVHFVKISPNQGKLYRELSEALTEISKELNVMPDWKLAELIKEKTGAKVYRLHCTAADSEPHFYYHRNTDLIEIRFPREWTYKLKPYEKLGFLDTKKKANADCISSRIKDEYLGFVLDSILDALDEMFGAPGGILIRGAFPLNYRKSKNIKRALRCLERNPFFH